MMNGANPLLDRGYIRAVLSENSIFLTPVRGQNFLVDPGAMARIIELAEIDPGDVFLEIGAGLGTMTVELRRFGRIFAIEYDHGLALLFPTFCPPGPDLYLEEGDFLKLDLERVSEFAAGAPINVVSNLPYSVAGVALARLLLSRLPVKRMTCMLQEEVAQRLVAAPGGKSYGFFSVLAQIYTRPEVVMRVSRKSFFPVPRVDSAVVRFIPRVLGADLPSREKVKQVISGAFSQRRKMLKNTLERAPALGYTSASILEGCRQVGIDPRIRPEQVTPEQFLQLASALEKEKNNE